MPYDTVIVGGGPGGLSAALALGRARKRVLLVDGGPRRNATAEHMQNFVTRDGTPPEAFRAIGREQLSAYPSVEVRDASVASITGTRGAFAITLASEVIEARRVILATGMIDELPAIEGFEGAWGRDIFQCPYCHGWEVQDRRWGFLAREPARFVPFAIKLRGWTRDLTVFTSGLVLLADARQRLEAAGVRLEERRITRLRATPRLTAIELEGGADVPCDVLFAQPPQRQVALVNALGLALDDDGYVRVDPMTRETSVPGIYAAGDLTTRMQGAIFAAASGTQAAAALNAELTVELATAGAL